MTITARTSEGFSWYRRTSKIGAAIVFVHGFTGHRDDTWGCFPALLLAAPQLHGWDVATFGYASRKVIDLPHVWRADAPIGRLAGLLVTALRHGALADYKAIAFIAHSMGGLVVQRALVDSPDLALRTSHLILFGTPSGGLGKARFGRWLKRQIRDMWVSSAFLQDLRARWIQPGSVRNSV